MVRRSQKKRVLRRQNEKRVVHGAQEAQKDSMAGHAESRGSADMRCWRETAGWSLKSFKVR